MQVGGSIGLFSLMTMVSFCLLAPIALLVEGPVFLPSRVAALGVQDPRALLQSATIAAATFHLYQQVSYMILARVSPVSHSIGNCVKRCVTLPPVPHCLQRPPRRWLLSLVWGCRLHFFVAGVCAGRALLELCSRCGQRTALLAAMFA